MKQIDVGLLCNAPTQTIRDGISLFENLGLYRAMMIIGSAYGLRFGIFGIDDLKVDGDALRGNALIWNCGNFEMVEAALPEHTESLYEINRRFMSVYPNDLADALIRRNISKINPPKDKLPQILVPCGLAEYIIPSVTVRSYDDVLHGLRHWSKCVIKPTIGKRGRGVMYLECNCGSVTFENVYKKGELTQTVWDAYRNDLLEYREFMLQPRLNFHNCNGQAIDFRVLVSKGAEGTWEIVDIYLRHGNNHIVSNVAEGGLFGNAREFLSSEFNDRDHSLYQTLCMLGIQIPQAYERVLADRAETFYGIDIGIDADTRHPYVIEVNAFPGTHFHKYQLAEKRVQYYKYLLQNR